MNCAADFSQPHSLLEIANNAKKTQRLIFLLLRGCCCASVAVVVVSCVRCLFVAQEPSVVVGEREREQRFHASIARPGRFSIVTTSNRQSRHWRGGACVFSGRRVVVVARAPALGNGKRVGPSGRTQPRFLLSVGERARSCGGALLMACAPCSALCGRLGSMCAAGCCVRGSTLCALGAMCAARGLLTGFFFWITIARHGCCISSPCQPGSSLLRPKR